MVSIVDTANLVLNNDAGRFKSRQITLNRWISRIQISRVVLRPPGTKEPMCIM